MTKQVLTGFSRKDSDNVLLEIKREIEGRCKRGKMYSGVEEM